MHRIFLPIYHYLKGHRAVMWSLLIASTLVFAWFGVKLRYEEDIMKLLPQTEESTELAFGEIDLKEKIFVQVTSADTLNPVSPAILGDAVEEFCHMLEERDSATRYISGILASLDVETGLNAMEYGLEDGRHVELRPSRVVIALEGKSESANPCKEVGHANDVGHVSPIAAVER